jgi:hypothetical protein
MNVSSQASTVTATGRVPSTSLTAPRTARCRSCRTHRKGRWRLRCRPTSPRRTGRRQARAPLHPTYAPSHPRAHPIHHRERRIPQNELRHAILSGSFATLSLGRERRCVGCQHTDVGVRPSADVGCTEVAAVADGRRERSPEMSGRIRLLWAGLLAAATTAALVGAPAMIHAGITFNALD